MQPPAASRQPSVKAWRTLGSLLVIMLALVGLALAQAPQYSGKPASALYGTPSIKSKTATYQALATDFTIPCSTIYVPSGSSFTLTLVPSTSQPPANACLHIIDYSSVTAVLVSPSGQNINGSSGSQSIGAASAAYPFSLLVVSDGTNYETSQEGGAAVSANSVPFNGVTGGAGNSQALNMGNSGVLGFTGTGIIDANEIYGILAPSAAAKSESTTYQALAADFTLPCSLIYVPSGTFTITMVASGAQPAANACLHILNYGTGVVTIARSGQNLNGGTASLTIPAGSATGPDEARVVSDGTNYDVIVFGANANAITVNGAAVPASASAVATNSSGQLIAASHGTCAVIGPTSTYSSSSATLTAALPASCTIPAGATVQVSCLGQYNAGTDAVAEKLALGLVASQTPQDIVQFGQIWTAAATSNSVAAITSNSGTGSACTTSTCVESSTVISSTTAFFNWLLYGSILWNASTPGTVTLGAATLTASSNAAIPNYTASCSFTW